MRKNHKLYVIVSLDVEEEGLFFGQYSRKVSSVENLKILPHIAKIAFDLGFPLTLFCTHTVFSNLEANKILEAVRDNYAAEIAAHLHHWQTPPLTKIDLEKKGSPERTHLLDQDLLREKLNNLLIAGKEFQGEALTSFRMGRWDLKSQLFPLLQDCGIICDSSICPLRIHKNGPDHFLAPADPYWIFTEQDATKNLLEVPITQIPLHPLLAKLWAKFIKAPEKQDLFHFWGALSANPFWHNLLVMQKASTWHYQRGGQVLSIFWHSSELLAGASPHVPNQLAVEAKIRKISKFLSWLGKNLPVEAITAKNLRQIATSLDFPEAKSLNNPCLDAMPQI